MTESDWLAYGDAVRSRISIIRDLTNEIDAMSVQAWNAGYGAMEWVGTKPRLEGIASDLRMLAGHIDDMLAASRKDKALKREVDARLHKWMPHVFPEAAE